MVKVHLILSQMALCNTIRREGGYQAVSKLSDFVATDTQERCKKCEATLRKMRKI